MFSQMVLYAKYVWLVIRFVGYYFLDVGRFALWRRLGRTDRMKQTAAAHSQAWSHGVFKTMGCRVEMQGQENIPPSGPVVVVCNHQDMFDIPLVFTTMTRQAGFVAKRELFQVPTLGFYLREQGGHPLDRADKRGGLEKMELWSRDLAARGDILVIFPEGTRSRDPQGAMAPFRRGALRLATTAHIPIVPMALDGTRFLSNPKLMAATAPQDRVVRVKILPPVPTGPGPMDPKVLVENIQHLVEQARQDILVSWPTPPGSSSGAAPSAPPEAQPQALAPSKPGESRSPAAF